MAFLLAALLGLAFGAADQYLGSMLWLGPWTSTVAQMSAPWLVVPFMAGMTQRRPRRAAALALVVTVAALVGYFAMTYSPMEVPGWSLHRFTTGMVAIATTGYNPAYILGGLVTAPLFGLLGRRWRAGRSIVSAVAVTGALCGEPLARLATGQIPYVAPRVWWAEIALGAVAAVLFMYWRRRPAAPVELTARP